VAIWRQGVPIFFWLIWSRPLQAYGYPQDVNLALERMAQAQAESLILHELGEAGVEQLLGPAWRELRAGVQDRRTELQLRAVRDLLADCEVTLPALLDRQDDASLHFWFANFEGLRPSFFPQSGPGLQRLARG